MPNPPIEAPGGYVPAVAVNFAAGDGSAQIASASNPMPVAVISGGAMPSLADQSVVDAAGTYWLVRDNGNTLAYVNWANGGTGTPVSPVVPAGKLAGEQLRGTQYNATAAGAGYATADVLEHVVVLNIASSPVTVTTSAWINITQGTILTSVPPTANLTEIAASVTVGNLPAALNGAAQDGTDAIGIAAPTGGTGIRGWLSGIYQKLAGTLAVSGSVSINNLPATQPVSWAGQSVGLTGTLPAFASTPAVTIGGPIPAGANAIGAITNTSFGIAGTLPAFAATPTVNIGALPAIPAGGNLIGAVNLDIGGATISASNPLPMIDAYLAPVATSWTTATTVNTAATYATSGYDTVIVTLVAAAGLAGGTVVFEVYDGANWMAVKASNILNYTSTGATITPAAGTTQGYQIPVAGFPQFRVRLATVLTAGTLGITTIISSASDTSLVTVGLDPAQPLPAGTNALGGVNVDNVADNAQTAGSISAAGVVMSASTTGYSGGSFWFSSAGTGNTVTFEQSDDNVNWAPLVVDQGTVSGGVNTIIAISAYARYGFVTTAAYVRARVSTYGSGTVTGTVTLKRAAPGNLVSLLSGTQTVGNVNVTTGYTDSTTALGASASFTGTGRATSAAFSFFSATAYADQAGTLYIDQSLDTGATYQQIAGVAVAAATGQTLAVRMNGAVGSATLYRVRFANGTTAQATFRLSSAYTAH